MVDGTETTIPAMIETGLVRSFGETKCGYSVGFGQVVKGQYTERETGGTRKCRKRRRLNTKNWRESICLLPEGASESSLTR